MIPHDDITAWRAEAPWVQDEQVEQDLVISRALVQIFSLPALAETLAFRGGTALYKLHLKPAARYSEDIDLVQIKAAPIGPTMQALRDALDPWLGDPRWKQNEGRVTLYYRFLSEGAPPLRMRLKVEINSREHFTLFGYEKIPFAVSSRWHEGQAAITSYQLDELMGTKLRALYQRRKGRDLFDLAVALKNPKVDPARVVTAFEAYMEQEDGRVTRAMFEKNLFAKLRMKEFTADIAPLLSSSYTWNLEEAAQKIQEQLINRLPGNPWKGE